MRIVSVLGSIALSHCYDINSKKLDNQNGAV